MSKRSDEAMAMFKDGFNCAQSVLACGGRDLGMSRETAIRLGETFGGGMCYLGQTCGAVTGALMAFGLKYSRGESKDAAMGQKAREAAREFATRFVARYGSINCTQILGHDLGQPAELEAARKEGLFATVCAKAVGDAVEILEEVLKSA
ncbi:MAG: C_GCAxxG_C_C family protein [Planctomycetes bacterium]|nr:C_GCAxxG_C_C family protein [Planctomycetota bacterium]